MKQYINWILKLAMVVIIISLPALANAQPGPGCDPLTDPLCVPLDGGLSLLIAAGIGYGIKKARDNKKIIM